MTSIIDDRKSIYKLPENTGYFVKFNRNKIQYKKQFLFCEYADSIIDTLSAAQKYRDSIKNG